MIFRVAYHIEGDDDNLIAAAKYGFAIMERATGKLKYIARAYDDSKDGEGKSER